MPGTETVPVIAIDGPVGSGKGTVANRVASALGFRLLDSGALYRVLALAARKRELGLDRGETLARLAAGLDIVFVPGDAANPVRTVLDGVDVTADIRTERCGNDASRVSARSEVRDATQGNPVLEVIHGGDSSTRPKIPTISPRHPHGQPKAAPPGRRLG